jgi:hypothetical protein
MPAMQQPEMSIGNAAKLFDESGTLTDDRIRNLVKVFIDTMGRAPGSDSLSFSSAQLDRALRPCYHPSTPTTI